MLGFVFIVEKIDLGNRSYAGCAWLKEKDRPLVLMHVETLTNEE